MIVPSVHAFVWFESLSRLPVNFYWRLCVYITVPRNASDNCNHGDPLWWLTRHVLMGQQPLGHGMNPVKNHQVMVEKNAMCKLWPWPLWYDPESRSFKEWVSFFLGSWGMNRSAGQTNRVNREAVLDRFVCSALRFIPHEPRKKDTHSLYLQCVQQRPFLKFSEKSYKFKILTVTDTKLHLMYKSLRQWFGPTAELFVDSVHRELNWKISAGFNEGKMIPL